jgi:hypothetical protein
MPRRRGLALALSSGMTHYLRYLALCGLFACASKPVPRSTTTTHTQTTTTNETGDNTSTDTKETTTQQKDGSSTVKKTQTTNTAVPATP